jgi:hypothetical protein
VSTKLAALALLRQHFPPTPDGKANLHTEVLEVLETYGVEAVLSEAAILLLARKAVAVDTIKAARRGELSEVPRPKLTAIEGGRNG